MGYTYVRHYAGGLAGWTEGGGRLEVEPAPAPAQRVIPSPRARARQRGCAAERAGARTAARAFLAALAERSIGSLLRLWLGMILGFGVIYGIAEGWPGHGLVASGNPVDPSLRGLAQAIYFSFVTALSIGYGDVVPVGSARVLAIAEGFAGLLIFGCVISKLVSQRQEEMVEEIHRTAFEDRLGRVRTNLHLVLSELQAITAALEAPGARPERLGARIESAATVFVGELRTIHDLLYRPQQVPEEDDLEAILASLSAGLRELSELLSASPDHRRSGPLGSSLRSIGALAEEICGECVPRAYAPSLKSWMDAIQDRARSLSAG